MERILSLCEGMKIVSFVPGEVLFPEGGKTGCLYIMISGAVEVAKGGCPITVILDRGAIFGEVSILFDQPHPASVQAVEETICNSLF